MGLYTEVLKKDRGDSSSERSKSDRTTSSKLSRHFKSLATSVSDFSERMTTRLFGFDVSSVKPSDQYEIHFIEINDVSFFFLKKRKRRFFVVVVVVMITNILLSIMNVCILLSS